MAGDELKQRKREDYKFILSYRTRWSDNDQYSHMNNSIYYHLFDSVINAYLIEHCGQTPSSSPSIGLVVSSYANFFRPLSFPVVLDLGLRANRLGTSSVEYEVGVFEEGVDAVAAVGGYTHVFVKSDSRRPVDLGGKLRGGLEGLLSKKIAKL